MALNEITDVDVRLRCGRCSVDTRVAITTLVVGVVRNGTPDERVIALPACATCASNEFLMRTPDDDPAYPAPGSYGHLHRMLVDHLHADLINRDKMITEVRTKIGTNKAAFIRPLTADLIARWFPAGLKIDPRASEADRLKLAAASGVTV